MRRSVTTTTMMLVRTQPSHSLLLVVGTTILLVLLWGCCSRVEGLVGVSHTRRRRIVQRMPSSPSRFRGTTLRHQDRHGTTAGSVPRRGGRMVQPHAAAAEEETAESTTPPPPLSSWTFPTRIQESMEYSSTVQRLYVRHIVTETQDMAEWVVHQYSLALRQGGEREFDPADPINDDDEPSTENHHKNDDDHHHEKQEKTLSWNTSADPFASLAQHVSACVETREEGGTIGWIDRPNPNGTTQSATATDSLLPRTVVQQLFDHQPKAGDVVILSSTSPSETASPPTDDDSTSPSPLPPPSQKAPEQQFHIVQVLELWTTLALAEHDDKSNHHNHNKKDDPAQPGSIGWHDGANVVVPRRHKKLKGSGISPRVGHWTDWSTYQIHTTGCQMNVADSERLEGVLQTQLQLKPLTSLQPGKEQEVADVILFNTCRYVYCVYECAFGKGDGRVRGRHLGHPHSNLVFGCCLLLLFFLLCSSSGCATIAMCVVASSIYI